MARPLAHRLLAVALLAVAALGCDGRVLGPSIETTRDLVEARARWNALRITHYEFTLQRLCFCGDTRPMRVTVRNGVVQGVRPEGELLPLPAPEAAWYPSIEGLFDIVAHALTTEGARVEAAFDAVRGFPHSVALDPYAMAVDDEVTYVVTNVRVL